METKDKITSTKDMIGIVRDATLILVVLAIVIHPALLAHWAHSFDDEVTKIGGKAKVSVGGLEVAFDHTSDTVAALNAANKSVTDLQAQVQKLITAAPGKRADQAKQIESSANLLSAQISSSLSSAKNIALSQSQILQDAPGLATGSGTYAIVVSADKKDDLAAYEVHLLKIENFNDIAIYDRQGFLRTLARFSDAAAANAALPDIQRKRQGAYMINLSKWCPNYASERTLADVPVLKCE